MAHQPPLFEGEKGMGILGIELEGLAEVRPAHRARRQGQPPLHGGGP